MSNDPHVKMVKVLIGVICVAGILIATGLSYRARFMGGDRAARPFAAEDGRGAYPTPYGQAGPYSPQYGEGQGYYQGGGERHDEHEHTSGQAHHDDEHHGDDDDD